MLTFIGLFQIHRQIFDGVIVPDSSVAVYLSGNIQAHALKIWPVEWSYGIAIQLELDGCAEGGYILFPEYGYILDISAQLKLDGCPEEWYILSCFSLF